jgi:hypothetical protein
MQRFCCGLILLLAAGILFSCGSKSTEKKFFDIPGYFLSEIDSIQTKFTTLKKTTVYNSDTFHYEQSVSAVNWKKEWALFLESNINRPIYYSNMEVKLDARLEGPRRYYMTKYGRCPIQRVEVYEIRKSKEDGSEDFQVSEIIVVAKKENLISSSSYSLNYWHEGNPMGFPRNAGYRIIGSQKIKGLAGENYYCVEGIFSK